MHTRLSFLLLIMATLILTGCDRPECKNTNPTFQSFAPGTKEYKAELAKQIQTVGTDNLSYWYSGYLKKNNKEYIIVNIQGSKLCALGEIEVKDWNKMKINRDQGGYRGAELQGLKIDIEQDSSGTNLVYAGLEKILD